MLGIESVHSIFCCVQNIAYAIIHEWKFSRTSKKRFIFPNIQFIMAVDICELSEKKRRTARTKRCVGTRSLQLNFGACNLRYVRRCKSSFPLLATASAGNSLQSSGAGLRMWRTRPLQTASSTYITYATARCAPAFTIQKRRCDSLLPLKYTEMTQLILKIYSQRFLGISIQRFEREL